jgi:hypothetical protein
MTGTGWLSPGSVSSTDAIGRAMIRVAARGAPKRIMESADIVAVAAQPRQV